MPCGIPSQQCPPPSTAEPTTDRPQEAPDGDGVRRPRGPARVRRGRWPRRGLDQAGEVQTARWARRGQRRARRLGHPAGGPAGDDAAGLPPQSAPPRVGGQARWRRRAQRRRRRRPHPGGAGGHRRQGSRRGGRRRPARHGNRAHRGSWGPRRAGQQGARVAAAQGPRLRAARGAGGDRRHRPGAQDPRRRRAHRVPVGGEVFARVGVVRGTTQDRRLPVHDLGAQPRGRHGRSGTVHHRRRARPHPGRPRGQGPGAGVPAAHRTLFGAGPRRRLRDAGAGPRPADRPRRHRTRVGAVCARRSTGRSTARRPHPGHRAQQGRCPRGSRAGRARAPGPRGPRARGAHRLGGGPHRAQGAVLLARPACEGGSRLRRSDHSATNRVAAQAG